MDAALFGFLHYVFEDSAGVVGERRAVRAADLAEHPDDLSVRGPPRQDVKRRGDREEQKVALFLPREPADRGAVEGNPVLKRAAQLGWHYRYVFDMPFKVAKGEPDELNILLFDEAIYLILGIDHMNLPFRWNIGILYHNLFLLSILKFNKISGNV